MPKSTNRTGSRVRARGELRRERIESTALRGNPLGDPHVRDLYVYLPPGYDAEPARRYPCVLILTGFLGIGENPWQRGAFGEGLHERMDRLIATGKCPPMILATPDCVTSLGGSQYVDSSAVGAYETFVVKEVVPYLDAHFRTRAHRDHRGVCGKSSGGYGALMLGMRHARIFGALASHSGDAYFDYCYGHDFVKCWDGLRAAGGVARWFKRFARRPKLVSADVGVLNILAMSAAYSPNPDVPWGFDLPFDLETAEHRADVLKRWRRHDPAFACRRHARALRSLRGIFIDCGLRDEYALHAGARILSRRLTELEVEHVHEEFDDDHRGIGYRYDRSLPFLGGCLS